MVESKLVELVVAGSNPVGHPIFFLPFYCANFHRMHIPVTPSDAARSNLSDPDKM